MPSKLKYRQSVHIAESCVTADCVTPADSQLSIGSTVSSHSSEKKNEVCVATGAC